MTIISRTTAGVTRRCDSRCHHATCADCRCICGGIYHGAGSAAATRLTEDWLGADWQAKKAALEAKGGDFEAVVRGALQQALGRPMQADLPLEGKA